MSLKARITEDMKAAMRAKDAARLSTIRLLLAAIKQREVDERIELTDADVLAIIDKMVKQRTRLDHAVRGGQARGPGRHRARRDRRARRPTCRRSVGDAEIDADDRRGDRRDGRRRDRPAWAR